MSVRNDRISVAYDSYDRDYKELCDNWRAIDQKSQGALQIAGVMIALLAGFAPKACEPSVITALPTQFAIAFGCVAFVLLTASAWLSLMAGWVQEVGRAPHGAGWIDIRELSTGPGISDEKLDELRAHQLVAWEKSCNDVYTINERKAGRLRWAQSLLLAGICAVTLASMIFLVGHAYF